MAVKNSDKLPYGLVTLVIFAFLITGVPKLNIRVGPVPIYMIDFVVLALANFALKRPGFDVRGQPFALSILALMLFGLLGEMVGFIKTGTLFEHTYFAIRTAIAFMVFFAVGRLIQAPKDLEPVLKAVVLGLLLTSSVMVLTSLPMTRNFVTNVVLDHNFLDPASERVAERYLSKGESGVRGRTLVGVSIMGATFINVAWPLAALVVWQGAKFSRRWRYLALVACSLAPMGVLMSYSRGPILGTLMIIFFTLVLRTPAIRRGILLPVTLGTVIVLAIGVNSEIFFFDRITNRTAAIFDDPLNDKRESDRLLAYVDPFIHVVENPSFFFVGEGNAITRSRVVRAQVWSGANHALFASSYYSGGLISSFIYMFLMFNALFYSYWHLKKRFGTSTSAYSQAFFLSVIALVPWVLFGHAMVSTARGAMLFFFVLGLLSTLRKFPIHDSAAQQFGGRIRKHVPPDASKVI